jgi:hypothetical protein
MLELENVFHGRRELVCCDSKRRPSMNTVHSCQKQASSSLHSMTYQGSFMPLDSGCLNSDLVRIYFQIMYWRAIRTTEIFLALKTQVKVTYGP